jgi:hypothetical protein
LDVTDETRLPDRADGIFDQFDLELFLYKLVVLESGPPDYSRYDLNGDGFTGGPTEDRFDLDMSGSIPSEPYLSTFKKPIEGPMVEFDENKLTDMEILCYYAYSELYPTDQDATDYRKNYLANLCRPEPPHVDGSIVNVTSYAKAWVGRNNIDEDNAVGDGSANAEMENGSRTAQALTSVTHNDQWAKIDIKKSMINEGGNFMSSVGTKSEAHIFYNTLSDPVRMNYSYYLKYEGSYITWYMENVKVYVYVNLDDGYGYANSLPGFGFPSGYDWPPGTYSGEGTYDLEPHRKYLFVFNCHGDASGIFGGVSCSLEGKKDPTGDWAIYLNFSAIP